MMLMTQKRLERLKLVLICPRVPNLALTEESQQMMRPSSIRNQLIISRAIERQREVIPDTRKSEKLLVLLTEHNKRKIHSQSSKSLSPSIIRERSLMLREEGLTSIMLMLNLFQPVHHLVVLLDRPASHLKMHGQRIIQLLTGVLIVTWPTLLLIQLPLRESSELGIPRKTRMVTGLSQLLNLNSDWLESKQT